jgi:hypothetical protein
LVADILARNKIRKENREVLLVGYVVATEISVAPENNNQDFIKSLRSYYMENMEKFKILVKFNLVEYDLYSDRLKKKR